MSIWLKEFGLFGQGASFAAALEDLLDEVDIYVEDWDEYLKGAPNHDGRAGWVWRVKLAADRDELREVILSAPSGG